MRDLIHDAIYPNTRVYHDANGNYRGSSTDITPFFDTPWPLLGVDVMAIYCPDTIAGTCIFHIRTLVLPEI